MSLGWIIECHVTLVIWTLVICSISIQWSTVTFWSYAFCTIPRLPSLIRRSKVYTMPKHSCKCVNRIHTTTAQFCTNHPWYESTTWFPAEKWIWLNMVSFVLLKRDLFSCCINIITDNKKKEWFFFSLIHIHLYL